MKLALLLATVVLIAGAAPAVRATNPWNLQPHHGPVAFIDRDAGFAPFFSSNCRRSGHTSYDTANVNVTATGDGVVQKGSNRGCYTPQNEPALAVSPTDPRNLVAGANDYRLCCDSTGFNDGTGWAYVSKDGGATWRPVLLPGLTRETGGGGKFALVDSAGDPSVAFAPDGHTVYYSNIVFSRSNQALSGVAVSTSHDGGSSWGRPRMVSWTTNTLVFQDKEWITVSPVGAVAVTWTWFQGDGMFSYVAPIVGAVATDGVHWSQPFLVSDDWHPVNQGSIPFLSADGTLRVVHQTVEFRAPGGSPPDGIAVSTRLPDGRRHTQELAVISDDPSCFPFNGDNRETLTGEQFRLSTMPSAALDPVTGTMAVAFVDGQEGCGTGATSAQVKVMFVNGSHHSAAQIVTHGADKAFPAVAYTGGNVTVGFYTRSFSPTVGLDYGYATSTDGYAEHRLSDGSSDPFEQFRGSFIGDYSSLVVGTDGVAHAAWTDSRGGDQNIMSQAFTP